MDARDGPDVGKISPRQLSPPLACEHDLLVTAPEVVAHPQVHLVPDHDALHVEEVAHQRAQREHREAVEHDVDVAVLAKHALTLTEKHRVQLRVVRELVKPARVVGLAVVTDDATVPETHMPVHARVRRVGDDQIHRRGRAAPEGNRCSPACGCRSCRTRGRMTPRAAAVESLPAVRAIIARTAVRSSRQLYQRNRRRDRRLHCRPHGSRLRAAGARPRGVPASQPVLGRQREPVSSVDRHGRRRPAHGSSTSDAGATVCTATISRARRGRRCSASIRIREALADEPACIDAPRRGLG